MSIVYPSVQRYSPDIEDRKQFHVSRSSQSRNGHREGRGERRSHQHAVFKPKGGRSRTELNPSSLELKHHIEFIVI